MQTKHMDVNCSSCSTSELVTWSKQSEAGSMQKPLCLLNHSGKDWRGLSFKGQVGVRYGFPWLSWAMGAPHGKTLLSSLGASSSAAFHSLGGQRHMNKEWKMNEKRQVKEVSPSPTSNRWEKRKAILSANKDYNLPDRGGCVLWFFRQASSFDLDLWPVSSPKHK